MVDEFVDCILINILFKIFGEEGLKIMKVVFVCFELVKIGRIVRIDY